jgi:hypothetical protein
MPLKPKVTIFKDESCLIELNKPISTIKEWKMLKKEIERAYNED